MSSLQTLASYKQSERLSPRTQLIFYHLTGSLYLIHHTEKPYQLLLITYSFLYVCLYKMNINDLDFQNYDSYYLNMIF